MSFEEFISAARSFDPESADTDISTIYDSLEQSYNDVLQGSQANLTAKDGRIQELESEISRLKSQNFDLLMSPPSGDDSSDDEDDESPRKQGIDSLFKTEMRFR